MAAIVIPAGAVTRRDGDPTETRKAQVAITNGAVVFKDASNGNKFNLADKNTAAAARAVGIAVNTAEIGEDVTIAKAGSRITVAGAVFTKGTAYFLGDTGEIIPAADIAAADYVTFLGVAASTTTLDIMPWASETTV